MSKRNAKKQKLNVNKKNRKEDGKTDKKIFDADAYDRKVGHSTALYELNRKLNIKNKNYNLWIQNNIDDLSHMHKLSNTKIDFDSFCNYIFDNSV